MVIIGIDPGSRKAGYAVIEVEGRKLKYVTSGVLRYDSIDEFVDRLGHIHDSCLNLLEEFSPQEVAFESLIYVKSIPALAKLAQARGAMISAFAKTLAGNIHEYSPNLVKQSVSGHGHANKESIDKALSMMFGKIDFKTHDESDALAVAVCHALNRGQNKIFLNKTKSPSSKKYMSGGRSLKDAFKGRIK